MKNAKKATSIFLTLLLLAGCAMPKTESLEASSASLFSSSDMSGIDSSVASGSSSTITESASAAQDLSRPPTDTPAHSEEIKVYAETLAKYFREPVQTAAELQANPYFFEFLYMTTFQMCQQNNMELIDLAADDWHYEYLIPSEMLQQASHLLFGSDAKIPEEFYSDADCYRAEEDAFLFWAYDRPPFLTTATSITEKENNEVSVTVSIARIEEAPFAANSYTFRILNDEQWGTVYQLLSIQSE